ncbi:MAG: metallophosphoesterase [Verrucomicrobiota bacterium]
MKIAVRYTLYKLYMMDAALAQEPTQHGDDFFERMAARLGRENLAVRMRKQVALAAYMATQGKGFFSLERRVDIEKWMRRIIKCSGLWSRGHSNYLDIRLEENKVRLVNLPPAFEGYRILHIADLHTDLDPELPAAVIQALEGLEYDICINTGDFRNRTRECHLASIRETRRIYEHVHGPKVGVLGNHDFIEKADSLEQMGIRLLLNENLAIEKNGERLWLVGVDDPDYYQSHDFIRALKGVPADACKLLLAHTPEVYPEAEQMGFAYQFSGHTHGGQICLPGSFPLITHTGAPTAFCSGPWRHGTLQGYTSRGTGGGCVPVRFNCPAEITLHTLTKA